MSTIINILTWIGITCLGVFFGLLMHDSKDAIISSVKEKKAEAKAKLHKVMQE